MKIKLTIHSATADIQCFANAYARHVYPAKSPSVEANAAIPLWNAAADDIALIFLKKPNQMFQKVKVPKSELLEIRF
ncbi:hypothetical protein T4B_4692 [Trichinella pseudospiralis]|uniref:Uncharacterized protein n=1 Tax=Trichinella pseudospiralis TaxID=6337 RepID=A0A0V1GXC4_TRIPS|nr:hypothetical protein T4B_4692 [Trichinella pseudospiralis]